MYRNNKRTIKTIIKRYEQQRTHSLQQADRCYR